MDEELLENNAPPIVCKKCNTVLQKGQKFCHNCGSEYVPESDVSEEPISEEPTSEAPISEPKKEKSSLGEHLNLNIIKSSLTLIAAVLMLITAFVPIVKVKYDTTYDTTLKFNAVEGIAICVNSLISLGDETLSEEQEELAERYSYYFSDWSNGKELHKFSKYAKKAFYIQLRSESVNASASMIILALASIAHITISVFFVIFASLALVSVFISNVKKPYVSLSVLFMSLSAAATGFNAYLFKFQPSLAKSNISGFAAFAIIFAFLVMLIFFVIRVKIEKDNVKLGSVVKRTLSLVFAFVLLVSCSAPIVGTEVKTLFANRETEDRVKSNIDASLFSNFSLSSDARDEYADQADKENDYKSIIANAVLYGLGNYSRREFKRGDAVVVNSSLYAYLLLCCGAYDYNVLFSFGAIAMILTELCALVIIWKEMYEFATGNSGLPSIKTIAKIISIVMSVWVIVLAIVMSVIVTHNAGKLDVSYRSWISYGPILALVSAVVGICIPTSKKKKE